MKWIYIRFGINGCAFLTILFGPKSFNWHLNYCNMFAHFIMQTPSIGNTIAWICISAVYISQKLSFSALIFQSFDVRTMAVRSTTLVHALNISYWFSIDWFAYLVLLSLDNPNLCWFHIPNHKSHSTVYWNAYGHLFVIKNIACCRWNALNCKHLWAVCLRTNERTNEVNVLLKKVITKSYGIY